MFSGGHIICRSLGVIAPVAAVTGAIEAVDEKTLVPLGILVAAIVLAGGLSWRLSSLLTSMRLRLERMEQKVDRLCRDQEHSSGRR